MFFRNRYYESKLMPDFAIEGYDHHEKLVNRILTSNNTRLVDVMKNKHYARIHTTKYIPMILYLSFMAGDMWRGFHIPTGIVFKDGKLDKKFHMIYNRTGIARSWRVDRTIDSKIDSYSIFLSKILKVLLD